MPSMFASLTHLQRSRDPSIDQRRTKRDLVDLPSHITVHGERLPAQIINLSVMGLMCRTDADISVGQHVSIWLPLARNIGGEVRWIENGRAGLEFSQPIDPSLYDAMIALIPPRPTAW